jgi:hypothetical protein
MKKGELGIMLKSLATFSISNSSFSILREARPGIFGSERNWACVNGWLYEWSDEESIYTIAE